MIAVDTNILVYSIDRNDPARQLTAQQLLIQLQSGSELTVLPWQVIGEFIQQLRRWKDQGKLTDVEFQSFVQSYRHLFPLVMPTDAVLDRMLDLSERYSLSHWDSMLLGACVVAGVTTLYTEDIGAPRTIDTLQLVNPFGN